MLLLGQPRPDTSEHRDTHSRPSMGNRARLGQNFMNLVSDGGDPGAEFSHWKNQ